MNEELKIIISAEIDKLRKELEKGREELEKFHKEGEKTGGNVSKAMATAGKAVGTATKAIAVGVAAAATAMVGVVEATREYRTEQAKLVSAFQAAGGSADQAKETYNDLYRVLGDSGQAVEAANHLAKLTTNQEDLAEYTRICQGVYATFGDSLPIESLTEAINETAKTGEVTGALADAVNWAGMSEDEFAEQLFWCNSEAEREALIRDTLNGLYGEAADAYETNAASILDANAAQAALTEATAALGEALEPVVTILKGGLAATLTELLPSVQLIAEGFTDMATGAEGGAAKMEEGITALLEGIVSKITEMLPMIITTGVQLITALINGISQALPDIITAIGELIPQITQALLNALPLLIQLVFDAAAQILATLGDILPEIVLQIVDILPQIIGTIVDNIPTLLLAAIDFLLAIVDAIPVIIPQLVKALPQIIGSILNALIDAIPILLDGAVQLFFAIVKAIPKIIPQLITALFSIVTTVHTTLLNRLGDVFKAVWNALVNIFKQAPSYFKAWFTGAVNSIKAVFSGLTNYFSSIWNSIKNIFSKVGSTIGNAITNTVKTAINGVLSTATKIINGFISAINTAISVINAIPGVSIKKLDKLNVPKLERGGVLKKGQVGLLEGNGTEAVVPLEKNTEWLDKIAARLSDAMGGNKQPIVLQVDGKTFAKTAISAMNNLTRQEGRLGLNLI